LGRRHHHHRPDRVADQSGSTKQLARQRAQSPAMHELMEVHQDQDTAVVEHPRATRGLVEHGGGEKRIACREAMAIGITAQIAGCKQQVWTMRRSDLPMLGEGASTAQRPLDALNFFLADVRDGLGPYLAIYLLTVERWDEASIGVVMSIATLAGLLAQTPAGALVDAARPKRTLVVIAALLVTCVSLSLPWLPTFWWVAASQATAHAAAAIFTPAIAAITLGVVGHAAFAGRIGRNESFNHAGNAFAAAAAGICAYVWGSVVVFWQPAESDACWRQGGCLRT
jgi:hypothetical protein